jgi:hypothetical protein
MRAFSMQRAGFPILVLLDEVLAVMLPQPWAVLFPCDREQLRLEVAILLVSQATNGDPDLQNPAVALRLSAMHHK